MGTPKTLMEAIQNGIMDFEDKSDWPEKNLAGCIKMHVLDYLSQKFAVAFLMTEKYPFINNFVSNLWKKITWEDKKND